MTVSMRVMSAGDGYRYLLKSVAAADGDRPLASPLVDYYTAAGTPPGRWLGSGLADVGDGQLQPGDLVSEEQLRRLLGEGRDPVTGAGLGHAYPTFRPQEGRTTRRAVAGYDLTFSVPKSASVLWALADRDTRRDIVVAHHQAIAHILAVIEREVAATRMGARGPDGAVAQVAVTGLVAAAFDHWDSRAGDPQLHTHLVVSNKVRTVLDGKWRSLDGRPLHAAMVALSEQYNGLLADHLTRTLGVTWEMRHRGQDRNPSWEIAGVPDQLLELFSSRSRAVEVETRRLVAAYAAAHGHQPSLATIVKLREQATLATRADKQLRSLADLSRDWQARAAAVLGQEASSWTRRVLGTRSRPRLLRAGDLPDDLVPSLGRRVVELVGERRATWRRWNLHAEASRQLMGLRFATTGDRATATRMVVDVAEAASLRVSPPDLTAVPEGYQRGDGASVFRPAWATVYTSETLLAAEDRLLHHARTTTAHAVPAVLVRHVLRDPADSRVLGDNQAAAVAAVCASGRVVDVLVGPAGAGKTTTMRAVRRVWEHVHGTGSVVGLAPSAAAAQVLADELGIATENTAKWLHDHTAGRAGLRAGQVVIVDEASLAGTHTLDRIATHAANAGAKVLLVGDHAQLAAVDAGGAFALLVGDRDDTPELHGVHRFRHDWERRASLHLRDGNPAAIEAYQAHDRLRDGGTDEMIDAAYTAWRTDLAAGRSSVLIAADRDTVTALNHRARTDRIAAGDVTATGPVALHDGTHASIGDLIITRRNDRRLAAGRGWVRNGDRWTITATHSDGALTLRRRDHTTGATVTLPANYVAAHVELGYAVTVHRAQGATVDTAHAIVQPGMTREALYVGMTRGRHSNIAYTCTDQPDTEPHTHEGTVQAAAVLAWILQHVAAESSAHQSIVAEQDRWGSIAQLAGEYETIAAAAQHDRWVALIRRSGLTDQQAETVIASDAFGPLAAALRRAEAYHHDVDTLLPRLVAARPLDDAHGTAAVLHHRLTAATSRAADRPTLPPRLVAGLIPQATGPMPPDLQRALDERQHHIEQCAHALAAAAITQRAPWTRLLRPPPPDPSLRGAWLRQVATIAAYRERYSITTHTPLGTPSTESCPADAAHARTAIDRAQRLAGAAQRRPPELNPRPPTRPDTPAI